MNTFNDARVRHANDRPPNSRGKYVLYWMQMFRRFHANHALDHAIRLAAEWQKPLVVYEALKLNYPWASARLHTFILQGMRDNAAAAKKVGLNYWPFVETPYDAGRGLVKKLAADACAIVTDDYPAFIVPAHNRALAARSEVTVIAVDGNSVVPLAMLGEAVSAAAHLRHRLHKHFAEAWRHRAASEPDIPKVAKGKIDPPFMPWDAKQDIAKFVADLPVDQTVPAVSETEGGSLAGRERLREFVAEKLATYANGRNNPDDPRRTAASGLSPYLHFGHIAIQEVAEAVLGSDWVTDQINLNAKGKREDFFTRDANVNSFLDEAVIWRDTGYQWHFAKGRGSGVGSRENPSWQSGTDERPQFNFETFDFSPGGEHTLNVVLPDWAKATLKRHEADARTHLYRPDELENADTHDELWNAAQRELVATGRMHNYMRMLWGKKVLEWAKTPAEAYAILEHLNNKYALDGRDPNSYTGIHWCFGLFDRPWPPERKVFGTVRYMSSENTAKKFRLAGYYEYVAGLGKPKATLF